MSQLILNPSDTSQWHALVNEAQWLTDLHLDADMESYLVFLLMRFSQSTTWIDSVLALDVLESKQAIAQRKIEVLSEVGDKSLMFAGLFPGLAARRHVSLEYYTTMGRSAYLTVADMQSRQLAALYHQLGQQFSTLQLILQSMRLDYYQAFRSKNSQRVWMKYIALQ